MAINVAHHGEGHCAKLSQGVAASFHFDRIFFGNLRMGIAVIGIGFAFNAIGTKIAFLVFLSACAAPCSTTGSIGPIRSIGPSRSIGPIGSVGSIGLVIVQVVRST